MRPLLPDICSVTFALTIQTLYSGTFPVGSSAQGTRRYFSFLAWQSAKNSPSRQDLIIQCITGNYLDHLSSCRVVKPAESFCCPSNYIYRSLSPRSILTTRSSSISLTDSPSASAISPAISSSPAFRVFSEAKSARYSLKVKIAFVLQNLRINPGFARSMKSAPVRPRR